MNDPDGPRPARLPWDKTRPCKWPGFVFGGAELCGRLARGRWIRFGRNGVGNGRPIETCGRRAIIVVVRRYCRGLRASDRRRGDNHARPPLACNPPIPLPVDCCQAQPDLLGWIRFGRNGVGQAVPDGNGRPIETCGRRAIIAVARRYCRGLRASDRRRGDNHARPPLACNPPIPLPVHCCQAQPDLLDCGPVNR
jgi:hypothetical protein